MNTNQVKKNWYVLLILSVVFITFSTLVFQSLPFYDIHKFNLTGITEIKIKDRGLFGRGEEKIKDGETIQRFAYLLKNSTKIKQSEVNLKANQGLCDVELVKKNNITNAITVVRTVNGGIIISGQYYYTSDSLLSMLIHLLKE